MFVDKKINMASHDQEAFLKAMDIVTSSTVHGVLTNLCELKVFDIIMQKVGLHGYLAPDEIALYLDAKNTDASSMLDRMLRLLANQSIIKCKLEKSPKNSDLLTRSYGLTSISQHFVQDQSGPSLASFYLFNHHKEMQISWFVTLLISNSVLTYIRDALLYFKIYY